MPATPHSNPRQDAVTIWTAGVDAVKAKPLVRKVVSFSGDQLSIEDHRLPLSEFDRIVLVGGGKAAADMAEGFVESVAAALPIAGWINVPAGTERPVPGLTVHVARPAGINEPTEEGERGTAEILRLVSDAGQRDLCVALISGGGSALLPAPVEGITLQDKLDVTRLLSSAGADITELNTVRKHLSRIKGGGLLRACRAKEMVTLVLSDVLGDPLDLIASGPTVPDSSSPQDALAILQRYDHETLLPSSVYECLSAKRPSQQRLTVPSTVMVIGNNAVAVDEAGLCAERLGYNHAMQSAGSCEGAAEQVGAHLADMVVSMLRSSSSQHHNDCLITGGEPVVSLAPPDLRGRGGRNQQLVLAAYQQLLKHQVSDAEWKRLAILSGGTDGEDGPTDAAGAVLDAEVHRRVVQERLDVSDTLARNDAYVFFQRCGGLLVTGPTGTNVCDVRVALVKPEP